SHDYSHMVTQPFYNDHTILGACYAFIIPLIFGFFILPKRETITWKLPAIVLFAILSIGLFLTYSRAAWGSFIAIIIFGILLILGLRFWQVATVLVISIVLLGLNQDRIWVELELNRPDSNEKNASLEQQAKSITSIKTDVSNAERLNRWSCAFRMANDRPIVGFGPGTYQFQYIPYQLKAEMTRISVKTGRGGNAHSEYFGPMAETGYLGIFVMFALVIASLYYGINVWHSKLPLVERMVGLTIFCGLLSYHIHALVNSFLDTDKAAFLYWSSFAFLVILDLKSRQIQSEL
ncbi:MAG: O-antigen ligase family protein, partial [Bacteroidia bacterium]|nr:O-antigen ligase family protein [Bacteroidia bacterium]